MFHKKRLCSYPDFDVIAAYYNVKLFLTKTNVDDGDENYLIESNYEIDKY